MGERREGPPAANAPEKANNIFGSWADGVSDEIAFWRQWLSTKGLDWPEDYAKRLDPDVPLQASVQQALASDLSDVRVLDAGAGPLTPLGKRISGRSLSLIASDALAPAYDVLLAEHGIVPVVRTVFAPNEALLCFFERSSFDIVHCSNSLDHSFDPVSAIRQMLAVTKVGGTVILGHYVNEAERENYQGLHQFNFHARDGHFFVASRTVEVCVDDALGIACECAHSDDGDWVQSKIVKREEYSDRSLLEMTSNHTRRIWTEFVSYLLSLRG